MMILQIMLIDDDADKLYDLQEQDGQQDQTIEQYATDLLRQTIRRRHPAPIRYDEAGNRLK